MVAEALRELLVSEGVAATTGGSAPAEVEIVRVEGVSPRNLPDADGSNLPATHAGSRGVRPAAGHGAECRERSARSGRSESLPRIRCHHEASGSARIAVSVVPKNHGTVVVRLVPGFDRRWSQAVGVEGAMAVAPTGGRRRPVA